MCQNLIQIEKLEVKTYFVKTKHIKMRRDIDELFCFSGTFGKM